MKLEDLPDLYFQDALTLLCGELLGSGISRQVYSCPMNEDVVIKLELTAEYHQNVIEWETWHAARQHVKAVVRYLAPCHHISDCGRWLVQARTSPIPAGRYPAKMPKFLTDFKRANYGRFEGRVVCHDYGTNLALDHGLRPTLRKADWWS